MLGSPQRDDWSKTQDRIRQVPNAEFQDFVPGAGAERDFRDALGRFATGVTVVTCAGADGPVGMTANSFSSLSLDPPLILWAPARGSHRFPAFDAAGHFAVHVLGADQDEICQAFAKNADAFDLLDWHKTPEGVPVFDACLARFECAKRAAHDGGDHEIHVGEVLRARSREGSPLIFFGGAYGGLAGRP